MEFEEQRQIERLIDRLLLVQDRAVVALGEEAQRHLLQKQYEKCLAAIEKARGRLSEFWSLSDFLEQHAEGFDSRAQAHRAVRGGRVTVNGTVARHPAQLITIADTVKVDKAIVEPAEKTTDGQST